MNKLDTRQLFESDESEWREKQVKLFQEGRIEELDLDLVFQLLVEMTRSDKNSVEGLARIVLAHLLKLKFQPEKKTRSWILSITSNRQTLNSLLDGSPSLRGHLTLVWEKIYRGAVRLASIDTGLPLSAFPLESPISEEELLDEDYYAGEYDPFS